MSQCSSCIRVSGICLSEKALIEVECNLETVDNEGKSALLNTEETAFL